MITSFSSLLLPPWAEKRVTDIQFYFVVLIDIFYYGCAFGVRVDGTAPPCDCPTACGGRWYAVPKGERVLRVLRVLKFDGLSGRGLWWRLTPQIIKKGRGWRHWTHLQCEGSKGSKGGGLPSRAMSFIMPPSAVTSTSSIIIRITTVHPFATSWPSSPKGDARTLRDLLFCVI